MLTVLSLVRPAIADKIRAAVDGATVLQVPTEGPVPPELSGEILLAYPWASANLAEVLQRGVRWVHLLGTGIDAFPLSALGDQRLTCSRGASAVPIAEWVMAMLLAFEKHLPDAWIHAPPAGGWSRGARGGLQGRTLGLVGLGSIATAVAERALPFGMRVLAYRRTAAPSGLPGVSVVRTLQELAAASDHLVVAAAATPATRGLIDSAILAAVRRGVHLVNVARGSLVDQDALRAALDDGRVAMASLDAVDPEPLPPGHWLYTHPRVRLSPHISWQAPGAIDVFVDSFVDNLRRYRAGEPLAGAVDREAGY